MITDNGTSVGVGNANPNSSAILDLTNSNSQGLVIPPVTATSSVPGTPTAGLIVYNSTTGCLQYYNGTKWQNLALGVVVTTPVITGPAVVGSSQTGVVYSVPSVAGETYSWSVSGSGSASIVGSTTGTSITVNWSGTLGTTASNTINVSVTPACLSGSLTGSLTVTAGGIATFAYTGSAQTYAAPATSILVEMWGAGGGGSSTGGSGGSGAYVGGTLSGLTIGQSLTLIVGGGGGYDDGLTLTAQGGYGGGGTSDASTQTEGGGGGGGRSALQLTAGTDWITAGGGGGGGYSGVTTYGGGGGATTGIAGGNYATKYTGGAGGTLLAGGAGGLYNNAAGRSNAGASQSGGSGKTTYAYVGGGGGGGYYGGGSGYSSASTTYYSSGGGGGSSFITNLTGATNTPGNTDATGAAPPAPNATGDYVTGVGIGGDSNTPDAGGNGLIVIRW
jgi:hypothetical protein